MTPKLTCELSKLKKGLKLAILLKLLHVAQHATMHVCCKQPSATALFLFEWTV